MPQPGNGGNSNQPPQVSMEKNLLLAFLLMGAVMFLSQYFFKQPQPPAASKTVPVETAAAKIPAPAPGTAPETAKPEVQAQAASSAAVTSGPPLPLLEIDTDLFHVTLSNQ